MCNASSMRRNASPGDDRHDGLGCRGVITIGRCVAHSDSSHARCPSGEHVRRTVADRRASIGGKAEFAGRPSQKTRLRFATGAQICRMMRTDQDQIERPEQLGHPRVHTLDIGCFQDAAADTALVGDDGEASSRAAGCIQCISHAVHRPNEVGITVVGNVLDERAIAIEQQAERTSKHQIPSLELVVIHLNLRDTRSAIAHKPSRTTFGWEAMHMNHPGQREPRHDPDHDPTSGEVTDERAVSTVPLDTEDGGQVVITQQNMGPDNQVGGGEFKDQEGSPTPDDAAEEQARLEERAPIRDEAESSDTDHPSGHPNGGR